MSRRVLHFTLGPVQGFVAQARRTRDLWGGSFLLSWLSGIAMEAVLKGGGRIVFPVVHDADGKPTDSLLAAIMRQALATDLEPVIGSLPNRFKAVVPSGFDADAVASSVRTRFRTAAGRVRDYYLKDVISFGSGTQDIWDRQIEGFWELAWVCGDEPSDGSDAAWLDARKHWRVPAGLAPEGGDHCTVMHAWQELSGHVRATHKSKQEEFWQSVRANVGKLDLRPDERLCAIAFVKRMLPRLAREDTSLLGWNVDSRNWPSTAYMAAVQWIRKAWDACPDKAGALSELAKASFSEGAYGSRNIRVRCLEGVLADFSGLDGNAFHRFALQNDKVTPLVDGADRSALVTALIDLQHEQDVGCASPFYALLLMDGDHLGMLLRQHPAAEVSAALAAFTRRVEDVVASHNGVTVYAGGDDVLALLPLDDAIDAAAALERNFRAAFAGSKINATLSGALVFAHFKQPLQSVMGEAHHLLDDIAKRENGRSSLAVAVLQGAGKNTEWVSAWHSGGSSPVLQLQSLAQSFRAGERQFSTRFFHGLGNLFGLLRRDAAGGIGQDLDEGQMRSWLVAEYLDNREQQTTPEEAGAQVDALLAVCRRHRRSAGGFELQASGARLVKFLVNPGEDA
ncbi:MAG: type III-B CRISPR-associated protein Cas10/Cmr2 [Betaproteobacteria bacterium]|nr:type III-B CRISPR-associated protein Cas10/Cmr2 [Betaproteobacteria bacterium]